MKHEMEISGSTEEPTGYLVRMRDGMVFWIMSDPVDWPDSVIMRVMCVTRCRKPW